MQFVEISAAVSASPAAAPRTAAAPALSSFPSAAAADVPPPISLAAAAPALAPSSAAPMSGRDQALEVSQNLLKHIPGEASGFYLLAVDSFKDPSIVNLGVIFFLALVLLIVVRWLAKASAGIMITTILAFILWMLIFDKGFLHVLLPGLLPPPMGLVVAVFYSILVTALASAGKIR